MLDLAKLLEGPVLSSWGHPDDGDVAAGGFMAMSARTGAEVVSLTATLGEEGSLDWDEWPPDQMGSTRLEEQRTASAILGVKDTRFLGYPDGRLHEVPFEDGVNAILSVMLDVQPRVVLTYGPDGLTGHRDHQVISAWTSAAYLLALRQGLPRGHLLYATATPEWVAHIRPLLEQANAMYGPDFPYVTPRRQLALDLWLEDDIFDLKMAAVVAHHSQMFPLSQTLTDHGGLGALYPWFRHECFRLA